MSHRALGRERYFAKHCVNTSSPNAYIEALKNSPYSQHRTMSIRLKPFMETLQKQQETNEFRELLGLQREEDVKIV